MYRELVIKHSDAARFADPSTVSRTCGVIHPAMITDDHLEILDGRFGSTTIDELFGYREGIGLPGRDDLREIEDLMKAEATHLN